MLAKLARPKAFIITGVALSILLLFYYASSTGNNSTSSPTGASGGNNNNALGPGGDSDLNGSGFVGRDQVGISGKSFRLVAEGSLDGNGGECAALVQAEADVNTLDVFKEFEFQPTWMKSKEYWDKYLEDRYERQKMDAERPPLKVIIVPHSHNDPGWLKTFEHYFNSQSRQIMSHMVAKLQQHTNLTFIWSEVAFLAAWWESAHPSKQRALRSLVQSGRLEITTGGWVMTDEANAHLYSMLDQLIEGHQWLQTNLATTPRSGWSIDPFGHGPTVPYLLSQSGITGTVIQRIHYAWKQWLAFKQWGDFRWLNNWRGSSDVAGDTDTAGMLTHNQPFDIYSIKHSCGPHPYICLSFDFRKVSGEYTEYTVRAQSITDKNVKEKSELLLQQYARTGSLFTHNVVLVPLGDDFRYNVAEEWDQQYQNYQKLVNYINEHYHLYKTNVTFGTPKDYFDEITKRVKQFPTLKGDFFVYSDIFSEGRPAYWSGYFTTRPFMKILTRQLEHNLRSAEILYSVALNQARQTKVLTHLKLLERDFERLVQARRNLGLFQHHDAITGTSKAFVMRDYGLKLFDSLRDTNKIQQNTLQSMLFPKITPGGSAGKQDKLIIISDLERDAYDKLPKKSVININRKKSRQLIIYSAVSHLQDHLIQVRVDSPYITITDSSGKIITHQVNPVWNSSDSNSKLNMSINEFEVVFIARLNGLSVSTFNVNFDSTSNQTPMATVFCSKCHHDKHNKIWFNVKEIENGDIQLENNKLKILFSGTTGFMRSIFRKDQRKSRQCNLQFGAYKSAQFHSGAYLFMPDPNEREMEHDVLTTGGYADNKHLVISSGPVSSELTVVYGMFLVHTVRIYHRQDGDLADAIYMENEIDFEAPPKNRETELFLRLHTDIQNGDPPELYTDSNGFQMQKRVKVERIGIEGNYFPITTQAYIEDSDMRATLVTNHAQGAASWMPGQLEVMLDRRTLYDDSRGMGEGVVDNRKTIHQLWLLFEDIMPITKPPVKSSTDHRYGDNDSNFEPGDTLRRFNHDTPINSNNPNKLNKEYEPKSTYSLPSLHANHISNALNYPPNVYVVEEEYDVSNQNSHIDLFNQHFPEDVHLLTLRSQPDLVYTQFPSNSALLVLHRQGYQCDVMSNNSTFANYLGWFKSGVGFTTVTVQQVQPMTLTGTEKRGIVIPDFSAMSISPMTLQTFNITFS